MCVSCELIKCYSLLSYYSRHLLTVVQRLKILVPEHLPHATSCMVYLLQITFSFKKCINITVPKNVLNINVFCCYAPLSACQFT